jgi:uncharacterized coiled-coil protein SlyX
MIRDCYGALAIISELNHRSSNKEFTETFTEMKKTNQESVVDLLEKALVKTKQKITTNVQEKVQELLELTFDATLDTVGNPSSSSTAPKSYMLKSEGYVGQVITENEFNHLVSVVKKEKFNPNALREVNELRKKARKQDRFTL